MKAAVFQGIGLPQRIEEIPTPRPVGHQVVVRVRRSGICGSDLVLTAPRERPSAFTAALDMLCKPGVVFGHEFAGEVIEIGPEVRRLSVGDRIAPMFYSGCGACLECLKGKPVWCNHARGFMGGYAQFALAHEDCSVKLSAALSWEAGALLEPLASCLHNVILAQMRPGARVLILGAGMIGLGTAFFARQSGAGPIVVTARSAHRAVLARRMGADAFLPQHARLSEEVADALGGPPDVVFEATGALGLINQAISMIRRGGTILVAGINLNLDPTDHAAALMKELRIQYAATYETDEFDTTARHLSKSHFPTAELLGPIVPLSAFPAVFESLRTDKLHCKIQVDPWM